MDGHGDKIPWMAACKNTGTSGKARINLPLRRMEHSNNPGKPQAATASRRANLTKIGQWLDA
jgi:hypothetical protein